MRCPWCGAVIADGSRFCPVCGRQLQGAKSKRKSVPRALLVAIALLASVAVGIGAGVALSGALSGGAAGRGERETPREDEGSREANTGLWGGADEPEDSGEPRTVKDFGPRADSPEEVVDGYFQFNMENGSDDDAARAFGSMHYQMLAADDRADDQDLIAQYWDYLENGHASAISGIEQYCGSDWSYAYDIVESIPDDPEVLRDAQTAFEGLELDPSSITGAQRLVCKVDISGENGFSDDSDFDVWTIQCEGHWYFLKSVSHDSEEISDEL